jgi:hypothetical protein
MTRLHNKRRLYNSNSWQNRTETNGNQKLIKKIA